MLIDTHCHLDPELLLRGAGRGPRARPGGGVGGFVCVGVGGAGAGARRSRWRHARSDVVATVGVHPHDAAALDDALVERAAPTRPGAARGRGRRDRASTTTTTTRRASSSARCSRRSSPWRAR